MRGVSFGAIVEALDEAGVRYLVAGGLAVNAHGYLRFTRDADLVVELLPENVLAAWGALEGLGYRPVVPIPAEVFASQESRERLVTAKGMQVLSFHAEAHLETPVDLFATVPFAFAEEYERAPVKAMGGRSVRFVSLDTLIAMKRTAGRAQDRADLEQLLLLREDAAGDGQTEKEGGAGP